jgi:putative glycerol kinase 5
MSGDHKARDSQDTGASGDVGMAAAEYVLALDVGTTTIRAHVYDKKTVIRGTGSRKIQLLYPNPGWVEMDENVLWQQAQDVIKDAIANAGLTPNDIRCMGITTQRNTFIMWDRETGQPFHRFIVWQDLRASDYVKQWNDSYSIKALNCGGRLLYTLSRKKRFLAAAVLRFKSAQVVMRLKWQIDHDEKLRQRVAERQVMFGCLDTWLLWQLTGHKVYATDYSNASVTTIFDPFLMEWSTVVSKIVGIPLHILPPVKDTSGLFGECVPELFGAAIPITAIVADQQGAMFGQCAFNVGDVKCTMGTGTFIDCNTGNKPHASISGLYPLIAWKIGDEVTFVAEGFASDTGRCIDWASSIGLFNNVTELEQLAASTANSDGVYFVPAFSGLQMPVNDDKASSLMIGLSLETTKAHIVRAVLESLAFRFELLYETVLNETKTSLSKTIKCDGGVCNNNFVVQLISNLTGCTIDRPEHMDMTSLGAAFLAGLAVGVWKNKEELVTIRKTQHLFSPDQEKLETAQDNYKEWLRALDRSREWYSIARSS